MKGTDTELVQTAKKYIRLDEWQKSCEKENEIKDLIAVERILFLCSA
jgi:hypothetical protein